MATVQSARSATTWLSGPFNVAPNLSPVAICLSPVVQAAEVAVETSVSNFCLSRTTRLSRTTAQGGCSSYVLTLCLMVTLTQHYTHCKSKFSAQTG